MTHSTMKEKRAARLVMEIYLRGQPVRSSMQAHEFQYNYLQDRMHLRYMENFATVVQDMKAHANRAMFNRGAQSLCSLASTTVHYPTRHSFEEEVIWLLWTQARKDGNMEAN
jgi:hypothetical protein